MQCREPAEGVTHNGLVLQVCRNDLSNTWFDLFVNHSQVVIQLTVTIDRRRHLAEPRCICHGLRQRQGQVVHPQSQRL